MCCYNTRKAEDQRTLKFWQKLMKEQRERLSKKRKRASSDEDLPASIGPTGEDLQASVAPTQAIVDPTEED